MDAHIHCNTCGREILIIDGTKPAHTCSDPPAGTGIATIEAFVLQTNAAKKDPE